MLSIERLDDGRGDRGDRIAEIGVGAGRDTGEPGVNVPGVRKKLRVGEAAGEADPGIGEPDMDDSSDRNRCDNDLT
jgi:hypothetical protein